MLHPMPVQEAICTTKIVVVEDHIMVREAFTRILSCEDGINVVGTAGTVAEAKNLLSNVCPDLVLANVVLPDGSGIDLVQHVKSEYSGVKVILLTALRDEESILLAIEAGVDGYIIKNSSYKSLLESIRLVMDGKQIYDPSIVSPLLRRIVRSTPVLAYGQTATPGSSLSAREREVVRLISRGLTDKEIAQALSLSIHTVKTHVRNVFKRLGLSSRRELLASRHLPPDLCAES